ncbi:MAG: type II toxin-antitoxin system VapC family toxin, partial [Bacilli bacterium]
MTNREVPIVCLDTNIFISVLRGNEENSKLCQDVLLEAHEGVFRAVTSTLAVVETVHVSKEEVAEEDLEEMIKNLYTQPWLTVWNVDFPIALESNRLSRQYRGGKKNSPHDTIYVATAKVCRASYIFTLDQAFIRRFDSNQESVSVEPP